MGASSYTFALLILFVHCCHALVPAFPAVTQASTLLPLHRRNSKVQALAISTELSTCGYLNGDPKRMRTANEGYNCRIDTRNGLWGFCPTTVLAATDCGLAGSCVDRSKCSKGCGLTNEDLTTFTCDKGSFCSVALLTFGVDQTYSYIACGPKGITDHYYITPTVDATTTSETSETTETTTSSESSDTSTTTSEETSAPTQSSTAESSTEPTTSVPSQEASNDSSKDQENSSPSPIGPIIGGIIGGLVVICGTTIAIVYLRRKNREKPSPKPDISPAASPPWSYNETKPPREFAGWGPSELPGTTHYGRDNAVELP
ncbi:hypothetical protein CEP51_008267 [Fusarium floridanum]|uniref:Mid2 domain-containing protein n=1 Tax=Fusarium floridanum TaxID=1325733 RepID=A0A428RLJ4_9HYPO|nr:hypothetical protein CEP51_008267 [Fusarium floridanum]